ncbi:MAG: hypothetical protein KY476_08945 [Planctomycetes bacterium]|nr:hypothetical protein [Planctomycetota bacterium]
MKLWAPNRHAAENVAAGADMIVESPFPEQREPWQQLPRNRSRSGEATMFGTDAMLRFYTASDVK